MKKSVINQILIPVVLLIWVGVGYRIFFYKENIQPVVLIHKLPVGEESKMEQPRVGTQLKLNYEDPFQLIGNSSSQASAATGLVKFKEPVAVPKELPKILPVPSPVDSVKWSSFVYQGLSSASEKNTQTALIRVFGRSRFLAEGDSVSGLSVQKISADSVLISFRGKQRFLYRE